MVPLMLGSSISSGSTSTNGRVSLTATTEITQATLTSQSSPQLSMKWGSGFQQHFASWLSHDLIALLRSLWNLMTLSRAVSCYGPWRRHSEHVTPTKTESSPLAMKTSWPWQFRTSLECALNCNSLSVLLFARILFSVFSAYCVCAWIVSWLWSIVHFSLLLIGACALILCSDNQQPLVPIQVNFPTQDLIWLCSVQSKEWADLVTRIYCYYGFWSHVSIILRVGWWVYIDANCTHVLSSPYPNYN